MWCAWLAGTLFGVMLSDVKRVDAQTGLPLVIPRAIAWIRAEGGTSTNHIAAHSCADDCGFLFFFAVKVWMWRASSVAQHQVRLCVK